MRPDDYWEKRMQNIRRMHSAMVATKCKTDSGIDSKECILDRIMNWNSGVEINGVLPNAT